MELVKLAQKGNEEAFGNLIQERKSVLYKTAYAYSRNQSDAIEIVQEAVYKAYMSISKLKEPSYFNTWLTRILINCAVDYLKKRNRIIPFADPTTLISQESEHKSVEEKMDLQYAIDGLEEKYKTVIILKYYQDLTIAEIADILECPIGTVKTYLHKGLKKLRIGMEGGCVNE